MMMTIMVIMMTMMTMMMTMMILALANPKSKCSSYAAELMRLTARPHAEAQNVMELLEYDDDDDDNVDNGDDDDVDQHNQPHRPYLILIILSYRVKFTIKIMTTLPEGGGGRGRVYNKKNSKQTLICSTFKTNI